MHPFSDDEIKRRSELVHAFINAVPHGRTLGLLIEDLQPGLARMRLPWSEQLIGDPRSGALHGGCITTLLDSCCGAAVFSALHTPKPIATLDIRIDYLHAGQPKTDVVGIARCLRVTHSVAFLRCSAVHEGDEDNPIALGTAAFMLGTKRGEHRRKTHD